VVGGILLLYDAMFAGREQLRVSEADS
jgi:hypothetical protein